MCFVRTSKRGGSWDKKTKGVPHQVKSRELIISKANKGGSMFVVVGCR